MRNFLIFLLMILACYFLASCSKPTEPKPFELPQPVIDQLQYCLKARGTVFIKSEIGKDSCEYIASPKWAFSEYRGNQIQVGIDYTHKPNCKNHK